MSAIVALVAGACWTFLVYAAAEAFVFRPRIERLRADALTELRKIAELEKRLAKIERGER